MQLGRGEERREDNKAKPGKRHEGSTSATPGVRPGLARAFHLAFDLYHSNGANAVPSLLPMWIDLWRMILQAQILYESRGRCTAILTEIHTTHILGR